MRDTILNTTFDIKSNHKSEVDINTLKAILSPEPIEEEVKLENGAKNEIKVKRSALVSSTNNRSIRFFGPFPEYDNPKIQSIDKLYKNFLATTKISTNKPDIQFNKKTSSEINSTEEETLSNKRRRILE